jgi:hypothetical protein
LRRDGGRIIKDEPPPRLPHNHWANRLAGRDGHTQPSIPARLPYCGSIAQRRLTLPTKCAVAHSQRKGSARWWLRTSDDRGAVPVRSQHCDQSERVDMLSCFVIAAPQVEAFGTTAPSTIAIVRLGVNNASGPSALALPLPCRIRASCKPSRRGSHRL